MNRPTYQKVIKDIAYNSACKKWHSLKEHSDNPQGFNLYDISIALTPVFTWVHESVIESELKKAEDIEFNKMPKDK